jgi:hypothetical protein
MKFVHIYSALLALSAATWATQPKDSDAVVNQEQNIDTIASWLAREEGLPLEQVKQLLTSPSAESDTTSRGNGGNTEPGLQKRKDQVEDVANEGGSFEDNAIESNGADEFVNQADDSSDLWKRDCGCGAPNCNCPHP